MDFHDGNQGLKNLVEILNGRLLGLSGPQLGYRTIQGLGRPSETVIRKLCACIQVGANYETVEWYLDFNTYGSASKADVAALGTPLLFYAVEENSTELVTLLLQHGVNPHGIHDGFPIPL